MFNCSARSICRLNQMISFDPDPALLSSQIGKESCFHLVDCSSERKILQWKSSIFVKGDLIVIWQRDLYGTKAEMVMAEAAAAAGGSSSLQQSNHRGSKFNLSGGSGGGATAAGMKTKWMKAFRTLTNSSSSQNVAAASGSVASGTGSSSLASSTNGSGSDSVANLSSTMKNSREYEKYVQYLPLTLV